LPSIQGPPFKNPQVASWISYVGSYSILGNSAADFITRRRLHLVRTMYARSYVYIEVTWILNKRNTTDSMRGDRIIRLILFYTATSMPIFRAGILAQALNAVF
jgi:hypothetical protein